MKPRVIVYNTFITPGINWHALYYGYNEKYEKIITVATNANYRMSVNIDSNNIELIPISKYFIKSKLAVHFLYSLAVLWRILFNKRPLLNVFLTQPPLFFIIGSFLSRLRGVPYVVHIMDMYPEVLVKADIFTERGLFYGLLKSLSHRALAKANGVICIGRCMVDRLTSNGVNARSIKVIRNFAAITDIAVKKNNENLFIDMLGLKNHFVILYMGNMGIAHEFSTAIECAKMLKEYTDIKFVFVGRGIRRKELESSSHGDNVVLVDYLEDEMFRYALQAGDIHLTTLRSGFEGLVVPSKFYNTLRAGKPTIYEGNDKGEVARTIDEYEVGTNIALGDVTQMTDAILRYYHNKEVLIEHGDNARKYHKQFADPERIGRKYYQATQTCING